MIELKCLSDYEKNYYFVNNGKIYKGNIFSVYYVGNEIVGANIISGENIFKVDVNNLYSNPNDIILINDLIDKL